jgi:uncharacterized protein YegP (UPF0339 family)
MTLYIYKDKKKAFRWHVKSKGRIVCEGGEGYKRKPAMNRVVHRLFGIQVHGTDVFTYSQTAIEEIKDLTK